MAVFTDASGSWGCGAAWESSWIQCQWNETWADEGIAVKELLPIVLAVAIWAHRWQHKYFMVHCDPPPPPPPPIPASVILSTSSYKSRTPVRHSSAGPGPEESSAQKVKSSSTDMRLPITPLILQSILRVIKRDPNFTNIMMRAGVIWGTLTYCAW